MGHAVLVFNIQGHPVFADVVFDQNGPVAGVLDKARDARLVLDDVVHAPGVAACQREETNQCKKERNRFFHGDPSFPYGVIWSDISHTGR